MPILLSECFANAPLQLRDLLSLPNNVNALAHPQAVARRLPHSLELLNQGGAKHSLPARAWQAQLRKISVPTQIII